MWIKQLCNHKVWDFAMALRVRKLFGTFEKRTPGAGNVLKVWNFSCGKEGYRVEVFSSKRRPWSLKCWHCRVFLPLAGCFTEGDVLDYWCSVRSRDDTRPSCGVRRKRNAVIMVRMIPGVPPGGVWYRIQCQPWENWLKIKGAECRLNLRAKWTKNCALPTMFYM